MLSFVEPSSDWPVTSSRLSRNVSFSQYRRSVSVPSESSSDNISESSSPIDEMKFEEDFISKPKTETIKKMTTLEKKKMRKAKAKTVVEKVKLGESKTESERSDSKNEKKKKIKRKWKKLDLSDVGFNMSLLPRPSQCPQMNDNEVHNILEAIDQEYLELEEKMSPYEHLSKLEGNRLEDKYVRVDRDRKIRKAHKQVKDKYCKSVRNNVGRKKLYVHHRVMRLMQLEAVRAHLHYPMPPKKNQPDRVDQCPYQSVGVHGRSAPPQNLAHALHNDNVLPDDLPTELISLLIALQHRDIMPEDYDTLLQLDESVLPKTISDNQLNSFKTDIVDETNAGFVCSVCLDPYEIGQKRKFLPCDHAFHDNCIDMWLKNSSLNCPLDGLPVVNS